MHKGCAEGCSGLCKPFWPSKVTSCLQHQMPSTWASTPCVMVRAGYRWARGSLGWPFSRSSLALWFWQPWLACCSLFCSFRTHGRIADEALLYPQLFTYSRALTASLSGNAQYVWLDSRAVGQGVAQSCVCARFKHVGCSTLK